MTDTCTKLSCFRFAPSPSGRMHFGNIYSAILSWLCAQKSGAEFVIRFEDIDARCKNPEFQSLILDDLAWLGLNWDKTPLVQSMRTKYYEDIFDLIKAHANVYPCFCNRADLHAASAPHASDGTPLYSGKCKSLSARKTDALLKEKKPAYRLEVPELAISFTDEICGAYSQNLKTECGDFVICRSDGVFAYQLCVVADDIFQNITDVVRGCDLLSSTPRQIFLYELLHKKPPRYYHHPVLCNQQGKRLSKRDKSCDMSFLRAHFSAENLIGWIAFYLGQIDFPQPLTCEDLQDVFCLQKVPKDSVIIADAFLDAVSLGV